MKHVVDEVDDEHKNKGQKKTQLGRLLMTLESIELTGLLQQNHNGHSK